MADEKVKLTKNARDTRTGASYLAGDEVEVSAETAERFRAAGVAEGHEGSGEQAAPEPTEVFKGGQAAKNASEQQQAAGSPEAETTKEA